MFRRKWLRSLLLPINFCLFCIELPFDSTNSGSSSVRLSNIVITLFWETQLTHSLWRLFFTICTHPILISRNFYPHFKKLFCENRALRRNTCNFHIFYFSVLQPIIWTLNYPCSEMLPPLTITNISNTEQGVWKVMLVHNIRCPCPSLYFVTVVSLKSCDVYIYLSHISIFFGQGYRLQLLTGFRAPPVVSRFV